jgi:hypothetical protein
MSELYQTKVLGLALEAEIADFVRERITIEYRIAEATRQHRKRSHLVRYRQLAKAAEIAEAA